MLNGEKDNENVVFGVWFLIKYFRFNVGWMFLDSVFLFIVIRYFRVEDKYINEDL